MGGKKDPKKAQKRFAELDFRIHFCTSCKTNREKTKKIVYTPLRAAALRASLAYCRSCKKLKNPKTKAMQTTNETRRTLRMFFGKRRDNANDHND
jgi:hypothetical protein